MTLQEIFDALIADLGGDQFDGDGKQRALIWEALNTAHRLGGYDNPLILPVSVPEPECPTWATSITTNTLLLPR